MWKKTALVLSLICYAVVLTLILLVVRFPKQTFISYAVDTIEDKLPGFTCGIGDVEYQYPLSLRFKRVSLANPAELLDINTETILISLDEKDFGNRGSLHFKLYGGIVETDVVLHRDSGIFEMESITLSGISLADIEPLQSRLGRRINGTLDYSGQFKAKRDELYAGVLSGNIQIIDLQVNLKRPILQNDTLAFDSVTASSVLQNGRFEISDGLATGSSYDGDFSGQISLAAQWQESAISISGELKPQEKYVKQNRQVARAVSLLYNKYGSRAIPYSISGSFRDPVFQFGETVQKINKRLVQ